MRRAAGIVAASVAASLGLMGQTAWAMRTPVHEAAESSDYGRKAGGMVGRGLLNVATSFVDIPVNIVNETKAGPPFVGTLIGIAKGSGCGVLRAASGIVDVATFWVPGFNGMPVSDSYENCLAGSSSTASASMATPEPAAASRPSEAATWQLPLAEPAQTPAAPIASASSSSATDAPAASPSKRVWKK